MFLVTYMDGGILRQTTVVYLSELSCKSIYEYNLISINRIPQ
jgi:hypothetical protein